MEGPSSAANPHHGPARARVLSLNVLLPLALGVAILLVPVPEGLSPRSWRYFALFATVIAAIITEPIRPAIIGLAGVIVAAMLGLVRDTPAQSAQWALSGFGNATVWLIFAGYVFALGYAETGLGKRLSLHLVRLLGHRTLGLGYAVTLADLLLAPFTASATARSAGTIYPIIRQIPELYDSRPGDGTSRRIGAYVLYTALSASFVTSSMFITALAPNTLAISIIRQTAGVTVSWTDWFVGFAPVGITLLVLTPLLLYKIYPPGIRRAPEAPRWAAEQLRLMGAMTRKETTLLALVCLALGLWIGASSYVDPAITAILVVLLMVAFGVVNWDAVIGHSQAWGVLIWFATLVTLAGGLADTKFVEWVARSLAPMIEGFGLYAAIVSLVGTYFLLHYFFASITAHAASLLPVFLAIALVIPGASPTKWALLLSYPLGLMGVLTTYTAGHNPIYYGSGYISRQAFWVLGLTLGAFYFLVYILIAVPWLSYLGV
ncbi:MAG TPA: DASS family sodium-coupled anion symporter [Vicinamibacterales bacterium]|nr:DASS family sodium-coupled anion symporter [Vicinamibacterales bacterium]